MHSTINVRSHFSMVVPVLSLNNDRQSVDGIQLLISEEFRDRVRVCVVSQIKLLIFQILIEPIRSVSAEEVLLNSIGGAMMVLRLL
jgi:hypothetical protein